MKLWWKLKKGDLFPCIPPLFHYRWMSAISSSVTSVFSHWHKSLHSQFWCHYTSSSQSVSRCRTLTNTAILLFCNTKYSQLAVISLMQTEWDHRQTDRHRRTDRTETVCIWLILTEVCFLFLRGGEVVNIHVITFPTGLTVMVNNVFHQNKKNLHLPLLLAKRSYKTMATG